MTTEPKAIETDSSNEQLDTSLSGATATWREPFWAGSLVFCFAAGSIFWHIGDGIAAGPWQNWAVSNIAIYDRPLLTSWLADICRTIVPANAFAALNVVNLLLGALACAIIAALSANSASKKAHPIERVLCGTAAGALFASTSLWHSAMAGITPATLTVVLTTAALYAIYRPAKPASLRVVFLSAAFVGLATANDPAFGIVALVLAVLAIHVAAARSSAWSILVSYFAGFALGAGIPFVTALIRGEGRAGFLSHALATPYPTLGDGDPAFGYLARLVGAFPWPVLAVSLAGLVIALAQGRGRMALGWSFIFLSMGPFLPVLTNQTRNPGVVTDATATQAMVVATVAIFASSGLMGLSRVFVPASDGYVRRIALACVFAAALVGYQWWWLPPGPGDMPAKVAEAVLADCPQDAVLVTGDARIYALLETVQAVRNVRRDVVIVPADALSSLRLRARVRQTVGDGVHVDTAFPPEDALDRWAIERPQALAALSQAPELSGDLRDLAIWELVRDNLSDRTFAFIGVSTPWITARVQHNGVVLVFPRDGQVRHASLDCINAYVDGLTREPRESEIHRTLAAMLLPLSDAARRQGNLDLAAHTAGLARRIDATDAGPWLVSARAAARGGDRDKAIEYVERYLWSHPGPSPANDLGDAIQEDLTRNAVAEAYVSTMVQDPAATSPRMRELLISDLWSFEEFQVLAEGYRMARERYIAKHDVDALCEGAAILTQLGELTAARSEIGEAVKMDPVRVWRRLKNDPRFDILRMESAVDDPVTS